MNPQPPAFKALCERAKIVHQRLSASDHNQIAAALFSSLHKISRLYLRMFVSIPAIFDITPPALYITTCQTDEISRPAGMSSFSLDRKSTRLNSSHVAISYAVFCLKK